MDVSGRLCSQVAAEAKVSPEKAMTACYLADLSRAGKTMNEAAALLRSDRYVVRDYARDWSIPFPDYARAKPLVLTWRKAKVGWELRDARGGLVAQSMPETEKGIRRARATSLAKGPGGSEVGSSHKIAMRRLSIALDHVAVDLFGVDDIAIYIERDGQREQVAPLAEENPDRLRLALAA